MEIGGFFVNIIFFWSVKGFCESFDELFNRILLLVFKYDFRNFKIKFFYRKLNKGGYILICLIVNKCNISDRNLLDRGKDLKVWIYLLLYFVKGFCFKFECWNFWVKVIKWNFYVV